MKSVGSQFSTLDILAYFGAYIFLFKFLLTPFIQSWIHRDKFYTELGRQTFYLLPGNPGYRGTTYPKKQSTLTSESKKVRIGVQEDFAEENSISNRTEDKFILGKNKN